MTKEEMVNHPDILKLIWAAAKKFRITFIEMDDLVQYVVLNMLERGVSEKHSLSLNVYNHTRWVYYNNTKKRKRSVETTDTLGDHLHLERAANFNNVDNEIDAEIMLNKLSERNRNIVKDYYYGNKTMDEIADNFNISKQRVKQVKDESLLKMSK